MKGFATKIPKMKWCAWAARDAWCYNFHESRCMLQLLDAVRCCDSFEKNISKVFDRNDLKCRLIWCKTFFTFCINVNTTAWCRRSNLSSWLTLIECEFPRFSFICIYSAINDPNDGSFFLKHINWWQICFVNISAEKEIDGDSGFEF